MENHTDAHDHEPHNKHDMYEGHEKRPKRLYRSSTNKVFAGICGGLGEYFNTDPVPIRLFWLLVVIFTGVVPGLVAYILAIFLIPEKHHHTHASK